MITNSTTGLKDIGNSIKNAVSDYLADSDFISRTVGMTNSYEGIMLLVQLLGREPVSLLGKDYSFIYDHVRRNYLQGTEIPSNGGYNCPKFTFYKDKPTIRFANPYEDSRNMVNRIEINPNDFEDTIGDNIETFYSESVDGSVQNINTIFEPYANNGVAHGGIASFPVSLDTCDIIKKTNDNFRNGKYKTLIARFHTNSEETKSFEDTTQTAISSVFGMSHGRNLLKLTPDNVNGYDNPYCRVWTYHHQYHTLQDAIRPFGDAKSADALESLEMGQYYGEGGFRRIGDSDFGGGSTRLDTHGVLNYRNNMVRIAPTAKIKDYFEHKENDDERQAFSTKRCMFSIENLAWKDTRIKNDEYDPNGLSPEQRGPLGGRIMWFPPYDLQFNEDVSVDWNSNKFIGRGENVYTYTNTERRGNLSFTLLIDHPSVLDYWTGLDRNGMTNRGKSLLPKNTDGVDGKDNQEQTLLRFFAGCDILTAKPQEYRQRKGNVVVEKDEKKDKLPDVEVKEPEKGTMYCILYYPNNYSGKDDDPRFAVDYLMFGVGTQKVIRKKENSGEYTVEDVDPIFNWDGTGYEVHNEKGISLHTWSDIKDEINYGVIKDDKGKIIKGVESAKNKEGEDGDWAKIVGSRADSNPNNDSTKLTSKWKLRRWYYRVDESTANQELTGTPYNYIDGKSYQMNSIGYDWVKYNVKAFNLTDEDELVSFRDLYVALTNRTDLSGYNDAKVDKIRKIFKQEEGYKVKKLTFKGHNSSHGRNKANSVNLERNKTLSSNRALTFKKWMEKMNFPMASEASASQTLSETTQPNNHKLDDVDNQYIKAWRSASVIIEYEKSEKIDAATAEPTIVNTTSEPQTAKVEIPNGESSKKTDGVNILDYISSSPSEKNIRNNFQKLREEQRLDWNANEFDFTIKKGNVQRYDNEGEFFEALKSDAPFLHNLISEKIKYFDPAFHSISPEGFNARLTFLHQCTRQGSTVENNSASDISTAYNLAFGRPPVCVLRIGDFYYTKIIIDSLSIQYETPQWDLNPEGIGVMPMFAKINIGFKFLGGSDLGGPIARLQNAVSFNYYANTSVYDDRAEMVQYNENGNGQEVKFKGWLYPNNANFGARFGTKESK